MESLTFHTSLLLGDLIYALAGIRQVCKSYDRKAIIYLGLNQKWPMADAIMRRGGITLLQQDFDMIRPLLMTQDYIEDVRVYNNEPVAVNLDEIMGPRSKDINIPYGSLPRWYFQIWPDMACDLSKKWIDLDSRYRLIAKNMIVVSRSARSHNPNINYTFLEKYKHRLLFIGHEDEHRSFCNFFPIKHYKVQDFKELAYVINSCKFFIGNQSFPYAIAEALKVPRILELWAPLPHVIPTGEDAYDYFYQGAFEYYVDKLIKE